MFIVHNPFSLRLMRDHYNFDELTTHIYYIYAVMKWMAINNTAMKHRHRVFPHILGGGWDIN